MRGWAKINDLKLEKKLQKVRQNESNKSAFFDDLPNKNKGGHNNFSPNFSSSTQRQFICLSIRHTVDLF